MYSIILHHLIKNIPLTQFKTLKRLLKDQWLPSKTLEGLQWKKFKFILKYAYDNVPFYHNKFKRAGIHPNSIETRNDLSKIPITTKSELKRNFPVISKEFQIKNCLYEHTSGSTGEPFTVYYDKMTRLYNGAISERMNYNAGFYHGDKAVLFERSLPWYYDHTFQDHVNPFLGILWNVIIRRKNLSLIAPMYKKNADLVQKFKPAVIRGRTSYVDTLAHELNNELGHLKSVITLGEVLIPDVRHRIQQSLQTEVFDQYGTVELGLIAGECSAHMGYHVCSDAVLLELIDKNGEVTSPGESGRIVATNLFNPVMPFIRYDTQDVGVPCEEACPCGRGFPLLTKIEGRTWDVLYLPNGDKLFPGACNLIFNRVFLKSGGIWQFQIIQQALNSLLVKVVRKAGVSDQLMEQTISQIPIKLKKTLPNMEVIVEEVNSIGKLEEKHRYIRSEINSGKIS